MVGVVAEGWFGPDPRRAASDEVVGRRRSDLPPDVANLSKAPGIRRLERVAAARSRSGFGGSVQ